MIIFTAWVAFAFKVSYCQQPDGDTQFIGDLIEHTTENNDEEIDYTDLFENLYNLYHHPLNLNTATRDKLEKLQVLSDFQIQAIMDYRKENGNFLTIYELQNVHGFSRELAELLMPFIRVGPAADTFSDSIKYGRNDVFNKMQRTYKSTDSSSGTGLNPFKMYLRYKYNYLDRVEFGMTAEKDPGEDFLKGANPSGFDFYSAHIQFNNYKFIRTLCLGDYHAGFGQGLTFWTGSSFGKSNDIFLLAKREPGIQRYISTNENRFLRGAGTTIQYKYFKFNVFYSRKYIDANPSSYDSVSGKITEVSALQTSGLHTTATEIKGKQSLGETILGSNLSCSGKRFKTGLTFVKYQYDAIISPSEKVYNQFEFRGNQNYNIGFDYQWARANFQFYGESAMSQNSAKATINGVILQASSNLLFNVVYRYYEPAYHAMYSGAISENTKDANEQGFLMGTSFQPFQKVKFSGYFDMFSFPWLKYGVYAPGNGYDYLMRLNYDPSETVALYAQIKTTVKPANQSDSETPEIFTQNKITQSTRLNISYHLGDKLAFRNRVEFKSYQFNPDKEKGYLLYQDVIYKPRKPHLKVALRYAIFDTEGYNSRIYAFEDDLLYVFSVPAYSGSGTRTYLDLDYELTQKLGLWLKVAYTNYFSEGSQLELKAQLHLIF
jgi:hypothetical protein